MADTTAFSLDTAGKPGKATGGFAAVRRPFNAVYNGVSFLLWRPTWDLSDARSGAASWGWAPQLALVTAAAVYVAALCANAHRNGAEWSKLAFYLCIAGFIVPVAVRTVWPSTSRWERIWLLVIATLGLFLIKIVRAPIGFIDHDEFLHWRAALDILETQQLFTHNPLLPVSSFYPGLEIATAGLASVSGLSVFAAGSLVVLFARLIQVCALFILYARITGSSRVSALGCLVYMGCSTFVVFNAQFSYESLALAFLLVAFFLAVALQQAQRASLGVIAVLVCVVSALATTHHVTSYALAGLLLGYAVLELFRGAYATRLGRALLISAFAILVPLAWSKIVGSSGGSYLGRIFEITIHGVEDMLQSFGGDRQLFVGADGTAAPLWQRSTAIAAVLLTCMALACGFLRALDKAGLKIERIKFRFLLTWTNSALLLLTLLTLTYPVSVVLRLSSFGWEFGNRLSTIAFLGVGVVVAVAALGFWWVDRYERLSSAVIGALAGVLVLGGIIGGVGQFVLVSPTYRVVADSDSIEPMGISAAHWARTWLGPNNTFMADRVNRLLFSTYGRQRAVEVGDSSPLLAKKIGEKERLSMLRSQAAFAVIDMRLTYELPVFGFVLDSGSEKAMPVYEEPLDPMVLLKFGRQPGVSRIFDNGYMTIADIRVLSDD